MSPQRIQLRRTRGWRKPEGAVVVARPSKWGNPYRIVRDGSLLGAPLYRVQPPDEHPHRLGRFLGGQHDLPTATRQAVDLFRDFLDVQDSAEVHAELAGRDLACWCPLDQPCHADVLLELANPAHAGPCLCGHEPDRHDTGHPTALDLCTDCDCPDYQEAPE